MKRHFEGLGTILVAGMLFLGMGATAGAQQGPPDSQQPEEIPAQYPADAGGPQQPSQNNPGAARVSFIHGDVSTQHSDSTNWDAATLNTPVVDGDHISTGQDSRAEIQLDHANILRMSGQSTANVVALSGNEIQVQVGQGLVNYDILRDNTIGAEIDTPNVAIRPQMGPGSYRILVNSDGETIVDVREGSAEISTPQGSTIINRDQRITIEGNADNAQYKVSGAPGRDDWDKWNGDRDHVIETAASWQHTNPYYTGTQDLDAYGHWNDVPDYGAVWFPAQNAGWAPYRDGRWVYEPYYGWTWVSYEPWGWTPYHYGRWFVYGGNWGWWPGPVYAGYRPLWAPAYVSFFGYGGGGWGVGVGIGFGNVGWLPCGPGDRFYPWYGRGDRRFSEVNIYNIHNERGGFAPLREGPHGYSNINRAFSNARVRDGISSMRSDRFGRGRVPMQQNRFNAESFRRVSLLTGKNPISPSRESFRSSDRKVSPGAIPTQAIRNQRFFSSNARRGISGQAERGPGGVNRGASPRNAQPQRNSARPGFRSFGSNNNSGNSRNTGNVNSSRGVVNRGASPRNAQPQRNSARPGFRSFGSNNNSGNVNRGQAPQRMSRPSQPSNQGQRNFTSPASRQAAPNQSSRPGFRSFTPPPAGRPQSNARGRTMEGQGRAQPQARPNSSQPAESPRQYQNNSRGNSNNYRYSRPPLVMQQPVVRPRYQGSYSRPAPRSAPRGAEYGRGGNRGGQSRGGYSGGGSRGGSPRGGGHESSGRGRR
ncbi:MAG TPA: DUF6600 domain-containing protein [Candidatus Dormibacteraeota bacterium]|nr:DUF6600 domain-containing protein [Candidatus Dormibacteraeota bacterium]